ncbi:hypothetical protein [Actinoplanes teichomyceticus]|uniref:Uncharacterized protein n=1 Tax=Actinoplanes teichomyceticus TaxID=1867 RepID=A0A561WBA1_ACTTI|nr:hypothetical protein [Actinoplanes teichomyceticus]TWG21147.1 hypothetical protein FHX34_103677 [Actinoplanes teichomyceticus]GIF14968.1 hypothetical protein Ate01nite_50000 [Actinoplanes teichomyceticus]
MTEQPTSTNEQPPERGAAEDASGVPVTPTDVEASRRPPSQPPAGTEAPGDDRNEG